MSSLAPAHRRARGARWAAVAALTAALVVLGVAGLPRSSGAQPLPARQLLERAAASGSVPHTGTAVSTGALGLPDLPQFGGIAALLGSSTRTRVQWASAQRWRVDVLRATGERSTYLHDGVLTTWDYEGDRLAAGPDRSGARLPRPDDLLPLPVLRALVAGPSGAELADSATGLGARTVAGRTADGVRLASDDPRGTLARADVWVDRASGLPLAVDLVDRAGTRALSSRFDVIALEEPAATALVPPDPVSARRGPARPDLAAAVDDFSPWRLPGELAGLPASSTEDAGVLTYGSGLTRLVLVPLTPDLATQAVRVARASGGPDLAAAADGTGGDDDAVLVRSGAVTAALVSDGDGRHAYLLAGTVQPELLDAAVAQLLAQPPGRRW